MARGKKNTKKDPNANPYTSYVQIVTLMIVPVTFLMFRSSTSGNLSYTILSLVIMLGMVACWLYVQHKSKNWEQQRAALKEAEAAKKREAAKRRAQNPQKKRKKKR